MKVRVDPEKCRGHIRCVQAAPEIFQQDEQGHSFTSDEDVPEEFQERVWQAEASCPERAITVTE
jgi:ferredoxin